MGDAKAATLKGLHPAGKMTSLRLQMEPLPQTINLHPSLRLQGHKQSGQTCVLVPERTGWMFRPVNSLCKEQSCEGDMGEGITVPSLDASPSRALSFQNTHSNLGFQHQHPSRSSLFPGTPKVLGGREIQDSPTSAFLGMEKSPGNQTTEGRRMCSEQTCRVS